MEWTCAGHNSPALSLDHPLAGVTSTTFAQRALPCGSTRAPSHDVDSHCRVRPGNRPGYDTGLRGRVCPRRRQCFILTTYTIKADTAYAINTTPTRRLYDSASPHA